MRIPILLQIGCFYMDADSLNVGRAIDHLPDSGIWKLLNYDGSCFDIHEDKLRVACKNDMSAWQQAAAAIAP